MRPFVKISLFASVQVLMLLGPGSVADAEPVITLGAEEVLYYGSSRNKAKPPLYMKMSVFENPYSPPHDGSLNTGWQMVLDGKPCPLRTGRKTFSVFLSQGYGMDYYEGNLYDPLKTRLWGVYNQNIAKTSWCRVPGDPLNDQWYQTSTLTALWPSYTTNIDKLYRGAPPESTVPWEKFFWIAAIYKVTAEDAAMVPSVHEGDLIGITHVEMSAIGQSNVLYNYRYALGISYSGAADNGKKWTYYGEIIQQAASQYDDVFVTVNNGSGYPGYCIHNISGGAFMRVGDYFHVYFDEYADTLHTPPMHEYVLPCVAVARANVTDVLSTIGSGAVGSIPSDQWKKYCNGEWNESAMTGRGDGVVPLPESEWPANYYNVGIDGQYTWPAASFGTHTCATACKAVDPPLYLLTLRAQTAQFSMHTLTENLLLYRSVDGINWTNAGSIYTRKFPYYPPEPYHGTLVQNCCFITEDAAASDDFSVVGSQFSVMYPVMRMWWPPFTADNHFDADLMLKKITVKPQ